jgi:hypothetical protein
VVLAQNRGNPTIRAKPGMDYATTIAHGLEFPYKKPSTGHLSNHRPARDEKRNSGSGKKQTGTMDDHLANYENKFDRLVKQQVKANPLHHILFKECHKCKTASNNLRR